MSTRSDFVQKSLELNLFFLRIMKEHSFFLEGGFTPANPDRAQRAEDFKERFDCLLREAVELANGVIEPSVLQSGEIVTPFTLNSERATKFFTSIPIDTPLTERELLLQPGLCEKDICRLECEVRDLNNRAIALTQALIQFKTALLNDVLTCRIKSIILPLLSDHVLREANHFLRLLNKCKACVTCCDR